MKFFNILLVLLSAFSSVFAQVDSANSLVSGTFFGEKFATNEFQETKEVFQLYQNMAVLDSLKIKFKTSVNDVCKAKGCWMKIDLANGEEAMVRFKDYGFFMPLDIEGKEVVLNGVAFVEEMSIKDQKHYAADAGASDTEIANITKPKRTYSFVANGVLLCN